MNILNSNTKAFPRSGGKYLGLTLVATCAMFAQGNFADAKEHGGATVSSIVAQQDGDSLAVRIKGDSNLAYTSYELPNPSRVVVDVADASLKPGVIAKMPVNKGIKLQTKEIADANPQILRFEFTLDKASPYSAKQVGNDLLVNFNTQNSGSNKQTKIASSATTGKSLSKQLPDRSKAVPVVGSSNKSNDDFGFSGYERERISVDFYKMDLHNVFRFLREISGTNFIVDEAVNGTLTLTLDNVPWDFALDVILNLKDLQKEERFNTIVIYPKKKELSWPGKSRNQLSFQADEDIAQQEALVISQVDQQPVGMVEAAGLIKKAREFEAAHNPAMAAQLYEQAFAKWNTNAKLANKISALYLVSLRQNTKALQYAQKALALDKKNRVAALNAAIASANMRDMRGAATYFDMAVQGNHPAQEALISYALFREEARQYDQALQILSKHESLYGRSLEAMVAKARILDKKGANVQAVQAYRDLLSSGIALPSDLARFVKARVGMAN